MTLLKYYSTFADICRYYIKHLLESIYIWAVTLGFMTQGEAKIYDTFKMFFLPDLRSQSIRISNWIIGNMHGWLPFDCLRCMLELEIHYIFRCFGRLGGGIWVGTVRAYARLYVPLRVLFLVWCKVIV